MNETVGAGAAAERCGLDYRYLALGLAPLLTYALYYGVLGAVQENGLAFSPAPSESSDAAEVKYRYFWVSAFAVSFAVSLSVGVAALLTAWRSLPPGARRVGFTLAIAGLLAIVVGEVFLTGERWYAFMGADLFSTAFCTGDARDCSTLATFDLGLDAVKYAGAFALVMLTLAFISTLRHAGGSPERRAIHLAKSAAQQRDLLRLAAAVYVMACLALIAWMSWPLPLLSGTEEERYRDLRLGSAVLQGVGYSLGVASIFLPPAICLRDRIRRLAETEADQGRDVGDWLREHGLDSSPFDQLRQAGTVLLPTLVGFLPALGDIAF